jgi:hypothetical protein
LQAKYLKSVARKSEGRPHPKKHRTEPEFSGGTSEWDQNRPNPAAEASPLQIFLQIWRAALIRPVKSHLILTPPIVTSYSS